MDGDLTETPLADLLIAAQQQRFSGTIRIAPDEHSFFDREEKCLRLEDGITVAADLGEAASNDLRSHSLLSGLIRLCAQAAGHYRCLPDVDQVGTGRAVLRGHVDPWTLLASSLRADMTRQDMIDVALKGVSTGHLQMRRGCEFERLGLSRDEWNFVQLVRRRGGSLAELLADSELPERTTRGLLYLLLRTGMLVRLPGNRKVESRTLSIPAHPEPELDESGELDEEHTMVCSLSELPFDMGSEEPVEVPKPISLFPGMDSDGRGFEGSRLFRLGAQALARGHLEDALARVDQALSHSPADPRFLGLRARIVLEQGGDPAHPLPEAMELAREALALDGQCELAHEVLGRVCKARGELDDAHHHFRLAALRNPANLYAVQEILSYDPSSSPERPSFWQRLRRSIRPTGS